MFSPEQDRVRAKNKGKVRAGIKLHADPIPSAAEFLTGIPHKNSAPEHKDYYWPPVRAIASSKMDCQFKLQQTIGEKIKGWAFTKAFPDLDPASGGQEPLGQ